VVGTGVGEEEIGSETHVGEAAPEVLEEATTTDVQVRMISFSFSVYIYKLYCEQRETEETIVTTIGGTLIDEKGMTVEETTGGMTMTATGLILGTEMFQNMLKLSLPRG